MLLELEPAKARLKPETYHKSFTAKLFLEEAYCYAEYYDQIRKRFERIQIEHFYNKQFRFKINVSI